MKRKAVLTLGLIVAAGNGCSSMGKFFGTDANQERAKPISNPFAEVYGGPKDASNQVITLRTKRGDRSVEVEFPGGGENVTDFVIPVSPAFSGDGSGGARAPASTDPATGGMDESYKDRTPTMTDRELLAKMPQGLPEDAAQRSEIERGLGLMASDETTPMQARSYLASIDKVKQLFRTGRHEAALLEVDDMLRSYPTNPKLYEMKGTLLDRLGQAELAVDSWNQALRYDPKNESLRRFIERKQHRMPAGR